MATNFTSNREKYLFHLEEFKKVGGTATDYCKLHDLRSDMLSYYKRQQLRKPKTVPQFAKLKIEPNHDFKKLPLAKSAVVIDPEWLAKLIHNLVKIK